MSTEPTSLRLDAETKNAAYDIFEQVGLKPAQAVNLFFKQVVLRWQLNSGVAVVPAATSAGHIATNRCVPLTSCAVPPHHRLPPLPPLSYRHPPPTMQATRFRAHRRRCQPDRVP